MDTLSAPFMSLDYLYFSAPDIDQAIRFYTQGLGGTLAWRVRHDGSTVAAVRLAGGNPLLLLADHLPTGAGLVVYRVLSLSEVRDRLSREGWRTEREPFELPQGPCIVFRDPGQQRLAAYERVRPQADRAFEGRFD
jgi:catechol 2,3-dioxygenase-like lactoylglutathione lyase family enzyme